MISKNQIKQVKALHLKKFRDQECLFIAEGVKIVSEIIKFKPEIILISAGFDAHIKDPLAHINVESEDYNIITKKIVDIAKIHSKGRVISFLEGGYELIALYECTREHISGLNC